MSSTHYTTTGQQDVKDSVNWGLDSVGREQFKENLKIILVGIFGK